MKILTAAQMRAVDQATIAAGIPSLILMENAAHRVVETIAQHLPLSQQRILVLCGKGNNGGDGLAIARQLLTRFRPASLDVVLLSPDLSPDAAANLQALRAAGLEPLADFPPNATLATLIIDAILGTGLSGSPHGRAAEWIQFINSSFPLAKVVAVDLPSGMNSDHHDSPGPIARADYTITFTAPKICHALAPNADRCGHLTIAPIGTNPATLDNAHDHPISLIQPSWFRQLFQPRPKGAHKGDFGHVLTIAGSIGKTGAAAMTALAALRAGAGLSTVATAHSALSSIASFTPELMTEPLPETDAGSISSRAVPTIDALSHRKSVLALGPGIGTHPDTIAFCQALYTQSELPIIVDADALHAITGTYLRPAGPRILTPHPGEMARILNASIPEVQADRLNIAQSYATDRGLTLILKGQRTIVAFPDSRVWVNPTGSPAMATAGSGDILTGILAGLISQFPEEADYAIGAAVWLHGRAGELAAAALGERSTLATDLLRFLPEAIRELENYPS